MNRVSPNVGRKDSFNDYRQIPASELFTPASELGERENYSERQLAQKLACVAVEEDSDS